MRQILGITTDLNCDCFSTRFVSGSRQKSQLETRQLLNTQRWVCVSVCVCTDRKPWLSSDSPCSSDSLATSKILTEVVSSMLSSSLKETQQKLNVNNNVIT